MATGWIRLSGQWAHTIQTFDIPRGAGHVHGLILGRACFNLPAFG